MENELTNFEDIIDNNKLLRGIYSYGFEMPSNIQHKSIPIISQGKDLIAQSQSGTGKTGSFSIGILNNIDHEKQELQKLILTPTHELTIQVYNVINELSKFMNIKVDYLIGKTSIKEKSEYDSELESYGKGDTIMLRIVRNGSPLYVAFEIE